MKPHLRALFYAYLRTLETYAKATGFSREVGASGLQSFGIRSARP